MPYIGSAIKNVNTRSAIDHQQFLGSTADTITNPGYYTFYVNYSPGNVTVIVAGSHISHTDYIATNGTDVRISNSAVTINANDAVEITGYNIPTSQVLERSDVNITGGKISGIEPLAIADGGTGLTSLGTAGQMLKVNNGGTALEFAAPSVSVDDVTGTLPVSKGGTGLTSLGTAGQLLRVNSGATGLEFATVSTGGGGGGDEIGWTHFATFTASNAGQQNHYLPNVSGWNTTHTDMYIIVEYFQPSVTAGFYLDLQYSSSSGSSSSHYYMLNYDLRGSGINFTAGNGTQDGWRFKMSGWEIGTSTAIGRGKPPCQGWIWFSNLHNSSTGASVKGHFVGTSEWGVPFEHSFGGMSYAGQNGAWQLDWLKPVARDSSYTTQNGSWKMNVYLRG